MGWKDSGVSGQTDQVQGNILHAKTAGGGGGGGGVGGVGGVGGEDPIIVNKGEEEGFARALGQLL